MKDTIQKDEAVIFPEDSKREASIGATARLPELGEALQQWQNQIALEAPADAHTGFPQLSLKPSGRLSRGNGGMRMTYRVFGDILRSYTQAPRNTARVLHTLPVAEELTSPHSPRACAYNAYLQRGLAFSGDKTVVLRTRQVAGIVEGQRVPVIVGAVSPMHSLEDGDDVVFIKALSQAFNRQSNMLDSTGLQAIRASVYRGIEVSELRAVVPAMRVEMASGEWWSGYLTVRNSEVGAASWSVSVGLVKEMDEATADAAKRLGFEGATLTVEANEQKGFHSGRRVGERVAAALEDAQKLLVEVVGSASELAAKVGWKDTAWVVSRLRSVLVGVASGDALDDALGALAIASAEWEAHPSTHEVVSFLGRAMATFPRRGQTYPLERLAGRVLLHGVDAALERVPSFVDVSEQE